MKNRHTIIIVVAAMTLMSLSGCTPESIVSEKGAGDMTITVASRDFVTKAAGVNDGDMFNNLTLLLLTNDYKVVRDTTLSFTKTESKSVTFSKVVFDDYKIAAFANLSEGPIKSYLMGLRRGDTFDVERTSDLGVSQVNNLSLMPLSGLCSSTYLASEGRMAANISMRRLYAWFELVIENSTGYNLKVENITLGNFDPDKSYWIYKETGAVAAESYSPLTGYYTANYNSIATGTSKTACNIFLQEGAAEGNYKVSMKATLAGYNLSQELSESKFMTSASEYVKALARNTHLRVTVTFEYSKSAMKITPIVVTTWVNETSSLPFFWE